MDSQGPNMLLKISGELTPERMKNGAKQNNTQLFWKYCFCDGSKLRYFDTRANCIGTWNVRSLNQGKLEVVKQETAGVNIDILGISELKWTGIGEFNSDDHYIYYCGEESLRRNGVAIMVNKRV